MIAIVDYGMANLRSVEKALARVGGEPQITGDPEAIRDASSVVLPGVGAFSAAMANLMARGLDTAIVEAVHSGKPFLGICLGLQMLFDSSTELGGAAGLGMMSGRVVRFFEGATAPPEIKVPHIGWNAVSMRRPSRLLRGVPDGAMVYFVHSYFPVPADPSVVSATSDHGMAFCCAVEKDNVAATQFHPEKSGTVGLQILRNFVEWR